MIISDIITNHNQKIMKWEKNETGIERNGKIMKWEQKMSWKKNELGKKYRHNGVKYFAEVFTYKSDFSKIK